MKNATIFWFHSIDGNGKLQNANSDNFQLMVLKGRNHSLEFVRKIEEAFDCEFDRISLGNNIVFHSKQNPHTKNVEIEEDYIDREQHEYYSEFPLISDRDAWEAIPDGAKSWAAELAGICWCEADVLYWNLD